MDEYANMISNILGFGAYTIGIDRIVFGLYNIECIIKVDDGINCSFKYNGVVIQDIICDNIEAFEQELIQTKSVGFFSEENGIIPLDTILGIKSGMGDLFDDEEPVRDWECIENTGVVNIVPDGITQIRVVALKLDNHTLAYRFKTDKGNFDIRRSVALKYGLGDFKVVKMTKLIHVNGLLVSDGEYRSRVLIPDVSENEEDCRKLISLLFKLN